MDTTHPTITPASGLDLERLRLRSFLAGLTGTAWLLEHWNHGWPGIVRALAFTVAMLLLSHAATRARLRMQL